MIGESVQRAGVVQRLGAARADGTLGLAPDLTNLVGVRYIVLIVGPAVEPGVPRRASEEVVSNLRELFLEPGVCRQERFRDPRVAAVQLVHPVAERREDQLQSCFAVDQARPDQAVAEGEDRRVVGLLEVRGPGHVVCLRLVRVARNGDDLEVAILEDADRDQHVDV
jgi:hypothetical protein